MGKVRGRRAQKEQKLKEAQAEHESEVKIYDESPSVSENKIDQEAVKEPNTFLVLLILLN